MLFFVGASAFAPHSATFYVGGDADKFYPVAFNEVNWDNNRETLMELGRSDVHTDNSWMSLSFRNSDTESQTMVIDQTSFMLKSILQFILSQDGRMQVVLAEDTLSFG